MGNKMMFTVNQWMWTGEIHSEKRVCNVLGTRGVRFQMNRDGRKFGR